MADIFISYSRKDSEQALALVERLRAAGMGVWIDQRGIEAATSWSNEIVQAVDESKAMLVLLSESSIASDNVVRELSLAFEAKKPIVPIDIETVTLPTQFRYQLAGIQRAQLSDFEGIVRSLEKLGVARTSVRSSEQRAEARATPPDDRKSLIILPFEDLSPAQDNLWFADGLAGEMIDALGHIKSLRMLDRKTSLELRGVKQSIAEIAKLFDTRYFIEGTVRKFGEQIKISVSLLDIETGDHLWQESHKGKFEDIFEIQELVAEKVVIGLKLHLTKEEKSQLAERGTENAEAYEFYVKADEYFQRHTKEGFQLAIQLYSKAAERDPGYSQAYASKANTLLELYRSYDRSPGILDEAELLCREALRLKPDLFPIYHPLAQINMYRGKLPEAEEMAKEFIRREPQNFKSYSSLGYFYVEAGQPDKAIAPYEESVRLKPDNLMTFFNLAVCCDGAGEPEKCAHWASVALPLIERHLTLHPDDESNRAHYPILLLLSGKSKEAHAAAMKLTDLRDGFSLLNTAFTLDRLGDKEAALRMCRKAIEAGFRNVAIIKSFLTDEKNGVFALQGTPEYEEVKQMVEAIIPTAGH